MSSNNALQHWYNICVNQTNIDPLGTCQVLSTLGKESCIEAFAMFYQNFQQLLATGIIADKILSATTEINNTGSDLVRQRAPEFV
jgi:hypothetical protein